MKICFILGTRPEIIKMSPIIRLCQERGIKFFILHTGQHYSANMNQVFFNDLRLPQPKYNLAVGNQPHRKQVGLMIKFITKILQEEKPTIVVVQGDTTSVLAGALAANKLGIKIAHHEAGLRSHDPTMLEETNRVITDHVSDFLCAPTKQAIKNLKEEGYPSERIFYTGNTIVDAVFQNKKIAQEKSSILKKLNIIPSKYVLITFHRAENVDKKQRLENVLQAFSKIAETFPNYKFIWPIHPRTKKMINQFKLPISAKITVIKPINFLDFLQLESNAKIIMTDSGGVQEESFILHVPCITLRDNTERPETLKNGGNVLVGTDSKKIFQAFQDRVAKKNFKWRNPFGDGKAAQRIVNLLIRNAD